jgi:UDP-N-acetylmuramate dehydrogenase
MDMQEHVSLKSHSTMKLGGDARYLVEVASEDAMAEAVGWGLNHDVPIITIGEGSNIVWQDSGYDGLVIVNKIKGFEKLSEDETSATFKIGAGEDWDSVVEKTTDMHLSGIECLSLIPGTAGATPVQNVGAYGQEIRQTLISVHAYDSQTKAFVDIANQDCDFSYRMSRFKSNDKGRFFITSITLKLQKTFLTPPFYASLSAYLEAHGITDYSPASLRKAVVSIRSDKLPDWHVTANNGSFFANPIVSGDDYERIKQRYPNVVAWEQDGGYKLSAGWLLETAGFKDFHDPTTGMATSDKSALVLINEHAPSTNHLLRFKAQIVDKVQALFGVTLEQEPELIP